VLAAYRTVRAAYDPARVNSVVLLTDGRNQDDPDSIELDTVLTTLRAEFDPAQPVPVITIGMGPDADHQTLARISEVTGTKSYRVDNPADIQQVFLDAMVERQCRPTAESGAPPKPRSSPSIASNRKPERAAPGGVTR
jgi:Ca-activated chloride channel homolog